VKELSEIAKNLQAEQPVDYVKLRDQTAWINRVS
jgi:hypothetical protein